MTDARGKVVLTELADIYSQNVFAIESGSTSLQEPLKLNESIEVPSVAPTDLTLISGGETSTAAQSITPSVITLTVDQERWFNLNLPARQVLQTMSGEFARQLAIQAMMELRVGMDDEFLQTYLLKSIAASSSYHDNQAVSALDAAKILNCRAALKSNRGANDIVLFTNPFGEAAIRAISGWQANQVDMAAGQLGIRQIGFVYDIPVYSTNSAPRNRNVAVSASAIATNVWTLTVPAGHGFVVGQTVYTTGLTANVASSAPATVTSVTSTTVVFTKTQSNAADNGTGFLVDGSCENLMVNRSQVFSAIQKVPSLRIVPHDDTTGDAMQISVIYGRLARAGHVRVLHSPATV